MINIENFKKARQWLIDWPEENFDMATWVEPLLPVQEDEEVGQSTILSIANHDCGTAACLGGLIQIRLNTLVEDDVVEFLGISITQENQLFFGHDAFYTCGLESVSKSQVLGKLNQIIEAEKWPDEFV